MCKLFIFLCSISLDYDFVLLSPSFEIISVSHTTRNIFVLMLIPHLNYICVEPGLELFNYKRIWICTQLVFT
jgi:hypothetical protein